MTHADTLAGRLHLRPGAPLPLALHSGRRDWAPGLAQGQSAAVLPGLLASLFSLCGHAHRLCAQLAIAAARGGQGAPDPLDVARHLRRESAQEHVRRIGLDWPRLLGRPGSGVEAAALRSLRDCPLLGRLAPADDPWPATRAWLESDWLHMPAATWLRAWQACGADWLLDWSQRHHAWLPAWMREARRADAGPALDMAHALLVHRCDEHMCQLADALAHRPGFAMAPQWNGACAHTGPWARRHGADDGLPLTPWALLGSRLAELVRLCLPDDIGRGARCLAHGATALPGRGGLAWVEMARGLLVHQVELDDEVTDAMPRVRSCRVLAPTEWNCHARGHVAARVAAMDTDQSQHMQTCQLNLLMAAFDPCVPFQVEAPGTVVGEVAHA
ncbi:MAG: hypothetical protein R3E99_12930 [Burkholderiaceae bacterium]